MYKPGMAARRHATSLFVLAALAAAACGGDDDGTGPGGGTATATVVLVDPPSSQSASLPALTAALRIDGTLTGTAEAYLSADGEAWEDITDEDALELRLQSEDSAAVGGGQVPGGSYNRLRLVLRDAAATVRAGVDLGGLVLDADVVLELGADGELVVEKIVPSLELGSGGAVRLIVDLNSSGWLTRDNAEQGAVSEAEVEASMRVRVETNVP